MIKVYNKHTQYLKISDKVIAPFKSEEFEERNQQIRILERNGVVSVTEVLNNNVTPTTEIKDQKEEIKEQVEETQIVEPVIEETEVIIEEENIIPDEKAKELKEDEIIEVKAEKVTTKRKRNSKKGGNK